MKLLEAKHVQLHGNMTVAGMNTREISPLRDGCVLHLHAETGAVYIQRDGETTVLSPMVVAAVELKYTPAFLITSNDGAEDEAPPALHPIVAQADADERANASARAVDAAKLEKGAHTLADEVLAELSDEHKPMSTAKLRRPASQRRS